MRKTLTQNLKQQKRLVEHHTFPGHSSFPVIHKVGNVVVLRSEGKINLSKKCLPPVGIEPATLTP